MESSSARSHLLFLITYPSEDGDPIALGAYGPCPKGSDAEG